MRNRIAPSNISKYSKRSDQNISSSDSLTIPSDEKYELQDMKYHNFMRSKRQRTHSPQICGALETAAKAAERAEDKPFVHTNSIQTAYADDEQVIIIYLTPQKH